MNKGFSLIELLAVIVILGIVSTIGIVSYRNIFSKSETDFYTNLIDNLELDGSNYFVNNRSKRPGLNQVCARVSLQTLKQENYLSDASDADGHSCDLNNSYVYIKRKSNKQYEYKVYLICDNYQETFLESEYCIN